MFRCVGREDSGRYDYAHQHGDQNSTTLDQPVPPFDLQPPRAQTGGNLPTAPAHRAPDAASGATVAGNTSAANQSTAQGPARPRLTRDKT